MTENAQVIAAQAFVAALSEAGVTDIVVSPGSRSTPLVLAIANEQRLRAHVILDERSAAFFALGQGRQSGRPTALVCTSGTAPSHYLPAVIEAAASFVPLLVVSADRPWDEYDCAAPQTIDQVKLFGDFVRHYAELGLADGEDDSKRAVGRIAAQAVARSHWPVPGPVHVNTRWRKPLEPTKEYAGHVAVPAAPNPGVTVIAPVPRVSSKALRPLAQALAERRGLIACGPAALQRADCRALIEQLAAKSGFALYAEATSQMRFGCKVGVSTSQLSGLVGGSGTSDVEVGSAPEQQLEVILELFSAPISARYQKVSQALGRRTRHGENVGRYVFCEHGWADPSSDAKAMVFGPVAESLAALLESWQAAPVVSWHPRLAKAEADYLGKVEAFVGRNAFAEASIVREVVSALPEGATLLLSNSNPVRDVDLFAPPNSKSLRVAHQRGCERHRRAHRASGWSRQRRCAAVRGTSRRPGFSA